MDYQLYENSEILLTENSDSKSSWSMESNSGLFSWNSLTIDQETAETKTNRKRKMPQDMSHKQLSKDPLALEGKVQKRASIQTGQHKMPHWQVEDYGDLNADIEDSLNLGSELVNHQPYGVSDNILSLNGMTVFKQEAPSPTSNEVTPLHNATSLHRHSPPSSTTHPNVGVEDNNSQNIFSNTINQLLSQTTLVGLQNVMDTNSLSPAVSQDAYAVSSTNYNLIEDCRFQYVLAAATSIATKQNEDTLTYLNQGQSYEIKLKKLGDLSYYKGKLLKSVIRICFHERRLQYMEKEQILSWQRARPGDRILEVDVPLSYGAYDIVQPSSALSLIHFNWDPTKEVGIYIRVNCISTEFTPKKHGGEKGVPFRIQIETYSTNEIKRLHAAVCQIKVFKLKGADRKHKQDREKIMKRPLSEQEKYQPSYECTVLNDLPNDAVLALPPLNLVNRENSDSNPQTQNAVDSKSEDEVASVGHAMVTQNIVKSYPEKTGPRVLKNTTKVSGKQLTQHSLPEDTVEWLSQNRFNKYIDTFEKFSGDDMLRMSREDLIQICGDADGIRLHNAIHMKTITPKLKLYICRDSSAVFNAVFLSSHSNSELLDKLSSMIGVPRERIRNIYIEGPRSIHVHLDDDMLKHIKEETMFSLQVMQDGSDCVLLLKKARH